jgi:hypothetical protein
LHRATEKKLLSRVYIMRTARPGIVVVDTAYVSVTVLMNKIIKFLWYICFVWLIMTAKALTRRMGPLSSIVQAGNLVNLI